MTFFDELRNDMLSKNLKGGFMKIKDLKKSVVENIVEKEIFSVIANELKFNIERSRDLIQSFNDFDIEELTLKIKKDQSINENPYLTTYIKLQEWPRIKSKNNDFSTSFFISATHTESIVVDTYNFWEDQVKSMIKKLKEFFNTNNIPNLIKDLRKEVVVNPIENEIFSVLIKKFIIDLEETKKSLLLNDTLITEITDATMKQGSYKFNRERITNYVKTELVYTFEELNMLELLLLANSIDEIFSICNTSINEKTFVENSVKVLFEKITILLNN